MEKGRKIKVLSLVTLIVAILGLTVAFAALSQTLTINGTASVDAATWDIHFESLDGTNQIMPSNKVNFNGVEDYQIPATISEDKKNIDYIGFVFVPGDTLSYNFKIVNKGTVDASINSIDFGTPTYYYTNLMMCENSTPHDGFRCEDWSLFEIANEEVTSEHIDLVNKYYTTKLYYKDTNEEVKPGDKIAKNTEKEVVLKVSYDIAAPSSISHTLSNGEPVGLGASNQELAITYVQD